MKYSPEILKNKNFFKTRKYSFPNALSIKYFWTLGYNHWGVLGITKLSNLSMPQKRLDSGLYLI